MIRVFLLTLILAGPGSGLVASAMAQAECESCRPEDEVQAGDYQPPAIPLPNKVLADDPRGRQIDLPIAGVPEIHHRAGAGVWLGEAGQGNNLFVDGNQKKASVGLRRDF